MGREKKSIKTFSPFLNLKSQQPKFQLTNIYIKSLFITKIDVFGFIYIYIKKVP